MRFNARKLCVTGYAVILFLCILGIMDNVNKNNTYNEVDSSFYFDTIRELNKMSVGKVEDKLVYQKPEYDLKGLDNEYQDLIFELCEKNNLSYELALSVMYQESKFDYNAVGINHSSNHDGGLYQINSAFINTYKNYAIQYCDFPEHQVFDVYNPEHNIRAGIGGLTYLKNKYESMGMGGEQVFLYVLGSYNQGSVGYERYISRGNSVETEYARKILYYKENLERFGRLDNGS